LSDGADYSRLDDHGVLVQVVAAILSRTLGAAQAPAQSSKFRLTTKPTASPAPSSAPARARSSATAPAPAVAEPELDVEAQVAVLQQAAKDGTPFCEECEKARKQQAAMA
jgi:guanyl-specific ribonuclease Sa